MVAISHRSEFNHISFLYILEVDLQLGAFKEYIEMSEKMILNTIEKGITDYELFLKYSSRKEIEQFYDFEDHRIKIQIMQLCYQSIYYSIYSFLEKKLDQLCQIAQDQQNLKINDLNGKGIRKYYNYIEKILKIDLSHVKSEWMEIMKHNELRNKLIHSPKNIIKKDNNNKQLINWLKSNKNIRVIDRNTHIEFEISNKEFLTCFCRTISNFLFQLYHIR